MEFDEVLIKHVGQFGLYQFLILLGGASAAIITGLNIMEYTLVAITPKYRCVVPDLNTYNFTENDIENFVSPIMKNGEKICDACKMYVRNYTSIQYEDIELFLKGNLSEELEIRDCSAWKYDDTVYHSTIVTEWDLVCERKWMITASQAALMTSLFFAVVFGFISDRFGRRTMALIGLSLNTFARIFLIFSVDIYMFIIGRFLVGLAVGWYIALFVLAVEMVGPKWRPLSASIVYYFFISSYIILAGYGYFIRDWRMLLIVGTVLSVPFFLHFWLLPESPRWLAANNRYEEAMVILRKMAKINRNILPDDVQLIKKVETTDKIKRKAGILHLFKSWYYMKISLILFVQWNAASLVYYGLTFYLPSLGGDIYLNLCLSGLIEIPAIAYSQIAMNTRLGRTKNIIFCFFLSGGLLLSVLILPKNTNWLLVAVAIVGKFGVSANFNFIYLLTSEIYPTQLRNVGLSTCSTLGRIGGVISPFIGQLSAVHPFLPAIVMGSIAVLAGILGFFLPETRGKNLEDTVNEPCKEILQDHSENLSLTKHAK